MEESTHPIPKNINECFNVLTEIFEQSKEEDRTWFKKSTEDEVSSNMHHDLGRWMRNTWGLWTKNTELFEILNNMGLWHADDMSTFIIVSYHRFINGKDLGFKEQIDRFIEYWKEYEKENGPVQK